jgi:hypothetical protein
MSLAMIALFLLLGIFAQQSCIVKGSSLRIVEKSKKASSESDLLLFEEDNELSDENESGAEWNKDFSFFPLVALLPEAQVFRGFSDTSAIIYPSSSTFQLTPLFLRIRSLRI